VKQVGEARLDARHAEPPVLNRATRDGSQGYSLVEVLFALTLLATLGGIAVPQLLATADHVRAAGAVRYLTTRLHQVRTEAVVRSKDVALQITQTSEGYSFATYLDGNGDGVRSYDIQNGTDPQLTRPERLSDHFSGVDFGALPELPSPDGSSAAPGANPIKLGSSNILTFTPLGTSSSGSLYVRSKGNSQYVIRILGETGKTRVLRFDSRRRLWTP
jgi:type II secretory pathway pseudopilin PulG